MKLETFFEKFDQFADAPNAVAKMRELVLELAVAGKMSDDSESWIQSPLGEVSRLRRGYDLPTQHRNSGSVPIFAANGAVGTHEVPMVKGPGVVTGRSGSIGKVHFVDEDFWPLNTSLYVEDFFGNFPQFICLLLRSLRLERYSTATAVPTLNRNVVHRELVKVPPLAEQKRIVAKVDELMALCDQLEAQQEERDRRHTTLAKASLSRFAAVPTPSNLEFLFHPSYTITPADLRRSILTLAVQGKLVPQDPNDELPAIPSDGQTVGDSDWVSRLQLPDTWVWARFESLLAVLKNGFNGKPSKVVGKFKVTRIETIARETIDLARVGYAEDLPGEIVAKHAVLKGDILFSHINSEPHLGKTAICNIDDPTLVHGVNLLLLRPIAGIDSGYLNIALRELRGAGYFVSIAQRAVNQASINQKNLGKTPIPLPPLAEQRRIVAKVEQLMALVDALEQQLAASRTTAANLLSALVAELTTGKEADATAEI